MNAREVIEGAIRSCIRKEHPKRPWGEVVVSDLSAAGFTIMPKEDVEAVRDKALEEAARHLEAWGDMYGDNAARSIRSLKATPQ